MNETNLIFLRSFTILWGSTNAKVRPAAAQRFAVFQAELLHTDWPIIRRLWDKLGKITERTEFIHCGVPEVLGLYFRLSFFNQQSKNKKRKFVANRCCWVKGLSSGVTVRAHLNLRRFCAPLVIARCGFCTRHRRANFCLSHLLSMINLNDVTECKTKTNSYML